MLIAKDKSVKSSTRRRADVRMVPQISPNPVQSYAAIKCKGMLPPSTITKDAKVSSTQEACGAAVALRSGYVRFELREVRCGLPTN